MKKIIFSITISLALFAAAYAENPFDISYPVAELGNCASQEECKKFCDDPNNHTTCIEWGKNRGVFTAVEAKRMSDMAQMENKPDAPMTGPGGCSSPRTCDAYCRVLENLDECLDYGVKNGYTSAEEAAKIKEQAQKGGPNGCKSREECDAFCKIPENMETCMKFVVDEGKITQEEADLIITMSKNKDFGKPKGPQVDKNKAQKVLEEVGSGPGECKTEEECQTYCGDAAHMSECMTFATEHGMMSSEEIQMAQKMMTMGGPGGCKTPQECDAFCSKEENRDTCFNFSKDNGLISPEEAVMMEKQMSIINKMQTEAGPGGCRSMEECSAFCNNPTNVQECMDYAAKTGMMSRDTVQTMIQRVDQAEKMQEFFMQGGKPPEGMMPPEGFNPPEGMMPPEGGGDYPTPPPGMMPPNGGVPQMPPEGFMPPPDGSSPMPPDGYQQTPPGDSNGMGYPMPPGNFVPPAGMMPPVESMQQMQPGEFVPPGDSTPPPPGDYVPPPPEETPPPPPPTSSISSSLFGAVFSPFLELLGF